MDILKTLIMAIAMTVTLSACQEDGPAEKMGESIDEAATDVGNAIEDACEDVKDGVNAKDKNC